MSNTVFANYIDLILPDYDLKSPVKIAEFLDRTLKFVAAMPGNQQRLNALHCINERTAITFETLIIRLKNIKI